MIVISADLSLEPLQFYATRRLDLVAMAVVITVILIKAKDNDGDDNVVVCGDDDDGGGETIVRVCSTVLKQ